jgi:hypothetical protein
MQSFFRIGAVWVNHGQFGSPRPQKRKSSAYVCLAIATIAHTVTTSCFSQDKTDQSSQPQISIISKTVHKTGEIAFTVRSPWQKSDTTVHVLVPDNSDGSEKLRVLFVLPVEPGSGTRWGSALDQIIKRDLHNKHHLICVYPTFSALPWFADHPSDKTLRQESYLVEGIVPFIDANFKTTAKPSDRLLVGFSKSGWGAFTLLLRNPNVFGKAAGWDAPFMMQKSGGYGSGPIFGTQENFAANYHLAKLVEQHAAKFQETPRLIHLGYGNFKDHHIRFEALLNKHNVSHIYRHGPQRKHAWQSGWLSEAVQLLVDD